MNEPINEDTNVDSLTPEQLIHEANVSKNRSRIKLLQRIHAEIDTEPSLESEYQYDPDNDLSYSGEFKAIST